MGQKIVENIQRINEQIKKNDLEEKIRIVKEYDNKSYAARLNVELGQILGCLFGASESEKIILQRRLYLN